MPPLPPVTAYLLCCLHRNPQSPPLSSPVSLTVNRMAMASNEHISFNVFSHPDESRPFGLEVEDRTFWVPKDGLCAYSPVFKSMLYGKFAEARRDHVRLPDKKSDEVYELLLCLFPTPVVKKIDDTNVDLLLDFADEYEIEDLTSRCGDFLQQKLDQLRNGDEKLLDILVLASKHRLRPMLFSIVERCAQSFELDKFETVFDRLSSEVLGALAWYKCQRASLGTNPKINTIDQQTQVLLCNNCRNGNSHNRCTACGGAQRCPLCNSLPKRARPCTCISVVAALARGTSMALMAHIGDNQNNEGNEQNDPENKKFDGAKMLLKRL